VPTYYELRVDADPKPYADGAATVVFIDMRSQKSKRIPEEIRARLERAEADRLPRRPQLAARPGSQQQRDEKQPAEQRQQAEQQRDRHSSFAITWRTTV